ncbi:putative 60S ribosomal protein yml6, mitochondrial [Amylocarpus encephaloides]|uniref:Large ribosomal subunit protein uL4m n=1 Tax=Amylocarpus encephaloides TaxID=45428 RepID=A0A9P8C6G3_9HELO|nr:putative 60S ribosomal protein yml6, mitochondrial [Amylocarpus encephaloides]
MATKGLQGLSKSLGLLRLSTGSRDPLTHCLAPSISRSMATVTSLPSHHASAFEYSSSQSTQTNNVITTPNVLTTIYKFPTMEPVQFQEYSSKYLRLPLRRDLLHRAVVFEGDGSRQGTASSKTRWMVHGAKRKIRPQKGTGSARLGSRQSPMLRGGGKSFGPHPRDFSTELPRKMYDLAWRTALSYRYRKGELIICEDGMDIKYPKEVQDSAKFQPSYLAEMFLYNHWGKSNGKSLIITNEYRPSLFEPMEKVREHGRARIGAEIDVKDLLTLSRIIIEKSALEQMLREHQSDLVPR